MALEDLAVSILAEEHGPLHYREILKRLLDADLWPGPLGASPERSLNMQMSREARLKRTESRLDYDRGSGIYWLRAQGTPPGRRSFVDSLGSREPLQKTVQTRSWLFQYNPDRFDLFGDIDSDKDHARWAMNQSYRQVARGDEVFFYRAGAEAGVVATGTIVSDGAYELDEPNDLGRWKVDLTYDSLVEPPISRDELRADPVLGDLRILRFANATNFAMEPAQARRLSELIDTRSQVMSSEVIEVRLLSEESTLAGAEAALRAAFGANAVVESRTLGFRGGQAQARVYWHEDDEIWGCIDETASPPPDRFWNAFGTAERRQDGGITCEVNPARRGINARVAGAFGVDVKTGHRLLLHTGRIGGGRPGVGPELFWKESRLQEAIATEGGRRFVIVADIDGDDVPAEIATFVHAVQSMKNGPGTTGPAAYDGSYKELAARLANSSGDVTLAFAEIEGLIGPLPVSARTYRVYWLGRAASSPTHAWKRAWEAVGYTVRTCDIPAETVTFRQLDPSERQAPAVDTARRYWWVNQGQMYEQESKGGYVWAPVLARNGIELAHHKAVSELRLGDMILHYQGGYVRALGVVTGAPKLSARPADLPAESWGDKGRSAAVDYSALLSPLALGDIPVESRIAEGGPFTSQGSVNQGYLYPLSGEFVSRLSRLAPEVAEATGVDPPDELTPVPKAFVPVTDLKTIADSLRAEGLVIDDRLLRRYHLSIATRGFVILSGISGTGKTWLAEAYARAVDGASQLVPVAPNWTTNEDLVGYLNPWDGFYHDTDFSRFIRAAQDEWRAATAAEREPRPYFLILDEMNLARVEYYFASFLSELEVRARAGTATLRFGDDEVTIGPNLKFVGTVNVDETTHGFADKVYDRAQLIELEAPREAVAQRLGDSAIAPDVLAVWDALHEVAPFAFRVVDEVVLYTTQAMQIGVPSAEALDEQLLQKVLPKVRGLDARVGKALEQFVALSNDRFPLSHVKAVRMLAGYNLHGSISFFE